MSGKENVDKRYMDTSCLLLEMVLNEPGSKRAVEAVARINYLHSFGRERGVIGDEEMLYTLSLFALEPMRWVGKYEWRDLTDVERCAVGTLWMKLGEGLGVKYDLLDGGNGKGWKDGLDWLEDLDRWSREYEDQKMVPAESNKKVADSTLYVILYKLPQSWKVTGERLVAAILDDRLREAML